MGKSKNSRNKVFSEEKKDRKDKKLQQRIAELEKENSMLRREIEAYKASGKVPAVKEKRKIEPPKPETLEDKRKAALEKVRKWRLENLGEYSEE